MNRNFKESELHYCFTDILNLIKPIQTRVCGLIGGGGMPWPQTGATQYHAQLGLPDKGRAIKGLVVCNSWDLEP